MTLEFTRLTQLTGDPKYYDAIARITEKFAKEQDRTNVPGLWPVFINPYYGDLSTGNSFSLGAMADSLYEYLPKTWALLGGREDVYRSMYSKALEAAKKNLFYKPLNPWKPGQLLAAGDRTSDDGGSGVFEPKTQHLTCFVGGMVALGAKLFSQPKDMEVARQLTDGCIWAYNSTVTGIAPEIFSHVACDSTDPKDDCTWSENRWHAALAGAGSTGSIRYSHGVGSSTSYPDTPSTSTLIEGENLAERYAIPPGFYSIPDRKYQLRPEAIESVFVLYRTTGDKTLRDQGWAMLDAILRTTRVEEAFAGTDDVTDRYASRRDRMESFWTAETLKYAWLLFAEEDQVSLDDWVFNTEAHPLKLESFAAKGAGV
jgi:mannosyl-oligosaccharide alpha-1,2-mannosidase